MLNRILADTVLVIHLVWIIFMIYGFVLTVRGFWHTEFWDRWLFRTLHLAGILVVAGLELLNKYCPLTILESSLRRTYNPNREYPGQFLLSNLKRLIYPDVDPLVVLLPTYAIALFTLVMFVIKRPAKFRRN
jgi:hypothetical protein